MRECAGLEGKRSGRKNGRGDQDDGRRKIVGQRIQTASSEYRESGKGWVVCMQLLFCCIYSGVDCPALAFIMKLNSGSPTIIAQTVVAVFFWMYAFPCPFFPRCFCCSCFVFLLFLTFCPRFVQITKFSFQKLPICTKIRFNLLPFSIVFVGPADHAS